MVRKYAQGSTQGMLFMATVALCAYGPSATRANAVQQLELATTAQDVVVRVAAEAPLSQPRVRYQKGGIKLWFPDVERDRRVSVVGDGKMVRRVRVRPGAHGTAMLQIDLGDGRRLAPGSVSVETHPTGAVVSIPRDVLPAPNPVVPAVAKAGLEEAPSPEDATVSEGPDAPVATNTQAHAKGGQDSETGAAAAKVRALANPSDNKQPETALSAATQGAEAGVGRVGVVVLCTLALLAALAGIRLWMLRRRGQAPLSHIEVIGARRLGAKQQLVLVRALGEDHLLCMHADRTERIASMPSPGTQADAIKLLPSVTQDRAQAPQQAARLKTLFDDRTSSAPPPAAETPFGAELLNFMARRSHPTWRPGPGQEEIPASPSVAGLLRLRQREAS